MSADGPTPGPLGNMDAFLAAELKLDSINSIIVRSGYAIPVLRMYLSGVIQPEIGRYLKAKGVSAGRGALVRFLRHCDSLPDNVRRMVLDTPPPDAPTRPGEPPINEPGGARHGRFDYGKAPMADILRMTLRNVGERLRILEELIKTATPISRPSMETQISRYYEMLVETRKALQVELGEMQQHRRDMLEELVPIALNYIDNDSKKKKYLQEIKRFESR